MNDLISRQDAIEAVDDIDWYHQNKNGEMVSGANPSDHQAWYKEEDIYNVLESLPSAEPKTPSNGSITCVKSEKMHDRPTDDLISRQDAIKAVEEERFPVDSDYAEGFMAALDKVGWILKEWLPSAQKTQLPEEDATKDATSDLISRKEALDVIRTLQTYKLFEGDDMILVDKADVQTELMMLPSAEPERLTDDDFETIRIHLNAQKEKLCNQQRWEEAEEYQRIIDRFMAFASAQPEIIRCGQCKYAEAADSEDNQDGYTCQFHRGSIWFSGSYCSWAERREECTP